MTTAKDKITFVRLPQIAPSEIVEHMSAPRVTEHMPLATQKWDLGVCEQFVAAKEACWARDDLGHWAFLRDSTYIGWGGFQKEGTEWDFGLVLKPESFGLGMRITKMAIEFARTDERIPFIAFLLPPSRKHLKGLVRLGAHFVEEIDYDGQSFLKYRLNTT